MEVSQESTTVLRWIFYSHRWTWVCGEQQGGVEFDANREVNMGAREEAGCPSGRIRGCGMRAGLVLKGATANMRGEGGTYHRWCTWLQSASWSMDNSHSMVLSSSSHIYFIYMEYFIPHIQRQDDVLSECRGTFSGYKFQLPISVGETVWG